ncbi:electron transport complex subunit RsxC [Caldisericum sp.]|jgi:electron transport complex protein RnfC|uniref:electron transport complex subunit RsxC n=1 Tax=Caldisericum sp. TaxID=2499687 RepID=UPI003D0B2B6D
MKVFTYSPGGIHPDESKLTKDLSFEVFKSPPIAVIPLQQHTGAPNNPLVQVGDYVKVGQKIGDSTQPVSAPVHATVSGKVIAIEERLCPTGAKIKSVIIENDYKDEWVELSPRKSFEDLPSEELVKIIREHGIVGLGGAAFPTSVKLTPPKDKVIDTIIGNGAECEPYLTVDHRNMLEYPEKVITGILIEMKITGAKKGIIAVEENKLDAANVLENKIKEMGLNNVEVVLVKTKYPQGGEKQLIKAVLKREVPSGGLPLDVGVVVQNVGTLKAITEAVLEDKPLIERGVTISGNAVSKPGNYIIRIGTLASFIIDTLGLNRKLRKLIFGGPMTGIAQPTVDVPVIKGTSGILMFGDEALEMAPQEESPCIRCASCVDSCPMGLMPVLIDHASRKNDLKTAETLHALDCIECGVCSYVCPAKRHLTENIKSVKQAIIKQRKIEAAKQAAFEKLKAQKMKEKENSPKEVQNG